MERKDYEDIPIWFNMVAYSCHHLSDNYVDLSDLYADLSVIDVDLSDNSVYLSDLYVDFWGHFVDLSEKYHHN